MKVCKSCGAEIDEEVVECPVCGSEDLADSIQEESAEAVASEVEEGSAGEDEAAESTDSSDAPSEENTEEMSDSAEESESSEETEEASAEDVTDNEDDFDDEYASEQEDASAKKKKIGIIIGSVAGAVAVVVAVICLFTFVDFGRNRAYDSTEKTFVAEEDVTGDTVAQIPFVSNPPYKMSQRFTDYQISINGAVYQVPMPVQEIINSGWAFGNGENADKELDYEATADTFFVSKDGALMYATIINFNRGATALKDCYVSSIKVDYTDNLLANVVITGDLALGKATKEMVEKLVGASKDVVELGNGIVATYRYSDKQNAVFTFNKETKVLESIKYTKTAKPYNFKEKTSSAPTNSNGGTVAQKPQALGNDITSGVVQIEGDIYSFPLKVSDFLANGWKISFKEDRAILYPGEHLFATFTRGEVVISGVDVENSSGEERLIRNCEIANFGSSLDDEYAVVLPGNLKVGMSASEFTGMIDGLEYDFSQVNFDEYTFTNGAYVLTVVVDKDEAIVNYISMAYDRESIN